MYSDSSSSISCSMWRRYTGSAAAESPAPEEAQVWAVAWECSFSSGDFPKPSLQAGEIISWWCKPRIWALP